MANIFAIIKRGWVEGIIFLLFAVLAVGAVLAPLLSPPLAVSKYAPAFGAALSIGTSGIVAFIFYYVVNARLERRKRELVRKGALQTYRDAKHNIAIAIIHASEKGGREDLSANSETIDQVLTISGFKKLFEGGKEAHEGFYAFQNQMSENTPEYDEIIFNLKIIGRAFDRLIDHNNLNTAQSYDFFVRLDALIRRIARNGTGYDESKLLCNFIWEVFSGWSGIHGALGHDPIERGIETA